MSWAIRLRYSGLVVFSAKFFGLISGLIFIIIVTRNLSVAEFGIWQYLSLILGYVTIPSTFMPFWITRFCARGYAVGKIGITSNLIVASVFFATFLLISIPAANLIKTDLTYFYIISAQIFLIYLYTSLLAIAQGRHPHLTGYAEMIFESAKIVFGLLLFYGLQMGLVGAIVAVILAHAASCLFYLLLLRGEIKGSIDWSISKKMFSRVWVAVPGNFAGFLAGLDLLILALIVQRPEPLALYRAATSIAVAVSFSASLAIALYPKLLSGGGTRDVEEILKLCFMFAIPMAVGAFVLAEPLLHIFKSEYEVATPLLKLMAVWAPIYALITVMESVIIGGEKVDVDINNSSVRKLAKSMLVLWPLFKSGRALFALPLVYLFVTLSLEYFPQQPDLHTALGCFSANFVADIFLFFAAYHMSKKALQFRFPIKSITRYVLAAAVMGLVVWVINPLRSYEAILTVVAGSVVYFAALSLIDPDSRKLFRETWKYLQSVQK